MTACGTSSLDERKRELRTSAKRRRAEAAAEDPVAAGYALCERVLGALSLPAGCVVSAYWPMGSELDPRPLMQTLHATGHPFCLPVVVRAGEPLVFRAWAPGDALETAGFGTSVPGADRPQLRPDLLIVPLLAFDRSGYRLGYGGGFYDRTLAELRAQGRPTAVGFAFAAQEVAEVPRDGYDQRLDWIVTEAEAVRIDGTRR